MPRITPLDNYQPVNVPVGPAIQDRERRRERHGGRIPLHAPNPYDQDWERFPEDQDRGRFEDSEKPPERERGIVDIDFTLLGYAEALHQTMSTIAEA